VLSQYIGCVILPLIVFCQVIDYKSIKKLY